MLKTPDYCELTECERQRECKFCGWNKREIRQRKKEIRENGLTELENGLKGYVVKRRANQCTDTTQSDRDF